MTDCAKSGKRRFRTQKARRAVALTELSASATAAATISLRTQGGDNNDRSRQNVVNTLLQQAMSAVAGDL